MANAPQVKMTLASMAFVFAFPTFKPPRPYFRTADPTARLKALALQRSLTFVDLAPA